MQQGIIEMREKVEKEKAHSSSMLSLDCKVSTLLTSCWERCTIDQ